MEVEALSGEKVCEQKHMVRFCYLACCTLHSYRLRVRTGQRTRNHRHQLFTLATPF